MQRRMYMTLSLVTVLMAVQAAALNAEKQAKNEIFTMTNAQVAEKTLSPYTGETLHKSNPDTLNGKVMTGYQGWFTTPGDGSGMGWFHWGLPTSSPSQDFRPGRCSVDLWPDMSEYPESSKVATEFKHKDGSTAYVFSSNDPDAVNLHFKWMNEYGIDGAFVQRFAAQTFKNYEYHNVNTVLGNCRAAANRNGRAYALMYDLSGLQEGKVENVIKDIITLRKKMKLACDPVDRAYLYHKGKPVIAVWGIGFNGRPYTLAECRRLVDFLKNDKKHGGFTVMLGVPTFWRTLENDSVKDAEFHEIIKMADIVSPWMVGRYGHIEDVDNFCRPLWIKDIQWCKEHNKDYMPVLFPGFSWYNLQGEKFDHIKRQKGKFLWKQYHTAVKCGAEMIYQAMFDEVDEATAIFKCTNNPPVGGESRFLTYEGLPSDHYLWLVGQGGKMLRREIPLSETIPERDN
jgi:hypothetical protein